MALARLDALAETQPELIEAVRFYRRLIPALRQASARVPAAAASIPDAASARILAAKFAAGVPLLLGEPFNFDPGAARAVLQILLAAIQGAGQTTAENIRAIAAALETGALDPLPLLAAASAASAATLHFAAEGQHLDYRLLDLAIQNALKVFYRAWAEGIQFPLGLDGWQRAACPLCGADAGLAEIRGVEAARTLRCLRCGAGWPYPNLRCAFCGNEDHRSLGVLLTDTPGAPEKYYAHTCDACQRYLKTVITFEPLPTDLLIVEDLATLYLDYQAIEAGYHK